MIHCALPSSVPSRQLRPFLPDRKLPQEQEFMVISAREPRVFLRQWSSGLQRCQDFSFATQIECKLLEYRNLTHLQLLQPSLLQVVFLHISISGTKVLLRLCQNRPVLKNCFMVVSFRARLHPPPAPRTLLWMWMYFWTHCYSTLVSLQSTLWTQLCTAGNR